MYFVSGRDADARRVADYGRPGATGEWAAQAAWISGLASWRMNDWNAAYASFREAASLAREPEFNAAAHYWTARAAQASRRPREVAPLLRAAARSPESFYGLMARETLGMDKRLPKSAAPRDLGRLEALPNIRRATELVAIGRRSQAEELLRHQAKIGSPADHRALVQSRREARACPARNSGSPISASRAPRSTPPTAIRCRTGRPTMAGGSIRRWPMPTSSRNRTSAPTRSARPARSA